MTDQATFSKTTFGVTASDNCQNGMDMLREIGGDFDVVKHQVSYQREDRTAVPSGIDGDGNPVYPVVSVPLNSHVAVRTDTMEHLHDRTVGDNYVVLQNNEMITIADEICNKRAMNYDFMSLLDGGRGLAIQVSCPELTEQLSIGDDENQCRLTLIDYHDGSGSLQLHFSLVRMMCTNTLPALGREFRAGKRKNALGFYSIKHTKNMQDRIIQAISTINAATDRMIDTTELLTKLADVRCDAKTRTQFFRAIANPEGKDEREMKGRGKTMYENRMECLYAANEMSCNKVAGRDESWYETLQAVTYYGTHMQGTKGGEGKSQGEKRFTSQNLGSGAKTNIRGMELALEMSGI